VTIIESLVSGEGKKRDIFLVVMIWIITFLLFVALSLSATRLPHPVVGDVSSGPNNMRSKLVSRVPISPGEFSVMLPSSLKTVIDEKGLTIAIKLPLTMGNSFLGVTVEIRHSDYSVIRPSHLDIRCRAFSKRLANNRFILKGPFSATELELFSPIISNGRFGYMARLKGKKSDKLYVEVYEDSRRMIFEIAIADGVLTEQHRNLLFAVVSSIQSFKKKKKRSNIFIY